MKTSHIAAIDHDANAIFAEDLLGLTAEAWEKGFNLTACAVLKALQTSSGFIVDAPNEPMHFNANGNLDN